MSNKLIRDVVICGGGIMGMSSAYHLLKRAPQMKVSIIEKDSTYSLASTPKAAGGVRVQFSNKENVLMSMYGSDFVQRANSLLQVEGEDPVDLQFQENGYLFLATRDGKDILHKNHETQCSAGATSVKLYSPHELINKFPWINNDGIELASFGEKGEGWFDPWLMLNALKRKVIHLGGEVINGEVIGFTHDHSIKESKKIGSIQSVKIQREEGYLDISCDNVINTTGAWGSHVSNLAGLGSIPVVHKKRQVFVVSCPDTSVMNGKKMGKREEEERCFIY